jgi:hypothetical protein
MRATKWTVIATLLVFGALLPMAQVFYTVKMESGWKKWPGPLSYGHYMTVRSDPKHGKVVDVTLIPLTATYEDGSKESAK